VNQENREVEEFCCRGDAVEVVVEVRGLSSRLRERKALFGPSRFRADFREKFRSNMHKGFSCSGELLDLMSRCRLECFRENVEFNCKCHA
jgi:hypothetical protein